MLTLPRIQFLGDFDILVELGHFIWRNYKAMLGFIVFNLRTVSFRSVHVLEVLTKCTARPRRN